MSTLPEGATEEEAAIKVRVCCTLHARVRHARAAVHWAWLMRMPPAARARRLRGRCGTAETGR
jgi:hypothetical protein